MSAVMDGPDSTDAEPVRAELNPHWDLLSGIHVRRTRLFGFGGGVVGVAAVAAPIVVALRWDPSVFQTALVAIGTCLVGLAVLRTLARNQAEGMRHRVQSYCDAHGIELELLVAAARRVPSRLYFFAALWDGAEVDKK